MDTVKVRIHSIYVEMCHVGPKWWTDWLRRDTETIEKVITTYQ